MSYSICHLIGECVSTFSQTAACLIRTSLYLTYVCFWAAHQGPAGWHSYISAQSQWIYHCELSVNGFLSNYTLHTLYHRAGPVMAPNVPLHMLKHICFSLNRATVTRKFYNWFNNVWVIFWQTSRLAIFAVIKYIMLN